LEPADASHHQTDARSWLDREFLKPMEEVMGKNGLTRNQQALQLGIKLEQKTIPAGLQVMSAGYVSHTRPGNFK